MIFDHIKNINFYKLYHRNFKLAFDFITKENIAKLDNGKYTIFGKSVYFSIFDYKTKSYEESCWEFHKRYADIHIIIKGEEMLAFTHLKSKLKITKRYSNKSDCVLLKGTPKIITKLHLTPVTFFIAFPYEIHMPGLNIFDEVSKNSKNSVRKAVFKIAI